MNRLFFCLPFSHCSRFETEWISRPSSEEAGLPRSNRVQQRRGALATQIAVNQHFNNLTLMVIMINVCWIGYDADANSEDTLLDAEVQFIVMESAQMFLKFCKVF